MRFTIEIPDELFRTAASVSQSPVTLSTSDAPSDAMSGGGTWRGPEWRGRRHCNQRIVGWSGGANYRGRIAGD